MLFWTIQQDLSCLFKGVTIKLMLMTDRSVGDHYVHRLHTYSIVSF